MIKSDKTKLELIRLEGIRNLIVNKINEEQLIEIIKQEFNFDSKKCYEILKKLNRSQLIKIIDKSNTISSNDIDETYEQYRYGLKPGFTIFTFLNCELSEINSNEITKKIENKLVNLHYFEDSKFKSLILKNIMKIRDNTFEFSFTYLSKYTYINDSDEPDYIYELKDCFVWINLKNNFLAIKNCPNDIQNKLLNLLSNILNVSLYNIKITKKLINEVFNGKIKKGTFIKPDATDEEVAKIIIADEELTKKRIYQDSVSSYDMSNTFLDEQLDDSTKSTLGINCKSGKIYLTKNVNATQFRNWSINNINKIINYLNDINNCKEKDIFQSRNILSNTNYSSDEKNIIENICYNIFMYINSGETSFLMQKDVMVIKNKLRSKFYTTLFGFCDVCKEETQLFCPKCNRSNLKLIKNGIYCMECDENILTFLCDEGHNIYGNNLVDIIRLIPHREFIDEINGYLLTNFGVRLEGSFVLEKNHLSIHKYSSGEILDYTKIEEFKKIHEINSINIKDQLDKYNKIKEKCKKCSNDECSICINNTNLCIMKLFIGFGNYRPSPHQGQEFGDVNFKITYEGKEYNFVGIAKSKPKSGILNLSDQASREMIQQILMMSRDKRVDVIGAICPAKFHDQLIQELYYLARITQVKIIILDDIFMSKLLTYRNI